MDSTKYCDSCSWRKNTKETNCSKEQLKLFLNNVALQSINITIPEKCSCCHYMFEYKCRSEKCTIEE
jgi:hypothetical protein